LNTGRSVPQKENTPGGSVAYWGFFLSQEVAFLGKDLAWEIITYALFPKLRLSVEHSLPKILVIF